MSGLRPGVRVYLSQGLGGDEGTVVRLAKGDRVQVDTSLGRLTLPVAEVRVACDQPSVLPWEHQDDDGDRIHIDWVSARQRNLDVRIIKAIPAGPARVWVPIAELLDVLQRATGDAS